MTKEVSSEVYNRPELYKTPAESKAEKAMTGEFGQSLQLLHEALVKAEALQQKHPKITSFEGHRYAAHTGDVWSGDVGCPYYETSYSHKKYSEFTGAALGIAQTPPVVTQVDLGEDGKFTPHPSSLKTMVTELHQKLEGTTQAKAAELASRPDETKQSLLEAELTVQRAASQMLELIETKHPSVEKYQDAILAVSAMGKMQAAEAEEQKRSAAKRQQEETAARIAQILEEGNKKAGTNLEQMQARRQQGGSGREL